MTSFETVVPGQLANIPSPLVFVIDGGGSTISTGTKGVLIVDMKCTITDITTVGNGSGAISVSILKTATVPTYPAVSIVTSAFTTATVAASNRANKTTGLNLSVNAGDILEFSVASVTNFNKVTISLKTKRA